MKFWTRIMMIVAAAFLAAQPVMACPMMVGDGASAAVSDNQMHHCAEMAPNTTQEPEKSSSSSDCPAGFDCPPMAMQAQADTTPTLTVAAADQVFAAVAQEASLSFPPERRAFTTGPPATPDLPPLTPISLKQRLLN